MTVNRPQRRLRIKPLHSSRRHVAARKSVAVVVGIAVLILIGGVAWFCFQPKVGPQPNNGDQTDEPDKKITAQRAAELLRKARIANGFLEDEDEFVGADAAGNKLNGYLEAEKRLAELHTELPHETLPLRNLIICRSLYLQSIHEAGAEERSKWEEKIRENIEELKKREPESAVPYLFSANFLEKCSETLNASNADERKSLTDLRRKSLEELRQAQRLEPDNMTAHWRFYDKASNEDSTPQLDEEKNAALKKIYRLAPDNIEFVKSYFITLARQHDPALVEILENSRGLIVTAGRMKAAENPQSAKPGENVFERLLNDASAAAKSQDWPKATQAVMLLNNLMKGMEIQRIDFGKLSHSKPDGSLNLLDYMQHDFSDKFYARIEPEEHKLESAAQPLAGLFPGEMSRISQAPLIGFQMVDFNKDVDIDIIGISDGRLLVLSPAKNGSEWSPLVECDLPGDYNGILCADLDRDARSEGDGAWLAKIEKLVSKTESANYKKENPADPDVIVFGPAGLKVFLNEDGLQEVEQTSEINSLKNITAAVLIDIEGDADLDLVVASESGVKILLNPGDRRFVDFSSQSLLPAESIEVASLAIADWDRDVDVDILVGDSTGNAIGVLENVLHGSFRWRPFGQAFGNFHSGRSLHVIEFDGSVSWDLVGAGETGFQLCLTETVNSQVSLKQNQSFGDTNYLGLACGDLDNDTLLDVIAWTEGQIHFFQGQTDGSFVISDFMLSGLQGVHKLSADDLDYDGDLDLIVTSSAGTQILRNQSQKNGWLTLLPIGIDESQGRSNHNGIGSLVELVADGRYQAQTITSERVHFGLNGSIKAEVLRIVWTNGMPQNVIEPKANLVIREVMFEKGSCPFIYVWNGTEFEFFSDCLWAAPIGLQGTDGNAVPTREWEYLKIPGDKLKSQNGVYRIQLTEELWEATYFDLVELIAVDHPEVIDIFTNEKVGPASIAEHKIYTVTNKRPPISAQDMHGRDVLAEIAAEDGRFMQGFEKRLYKGLTPLHYLELDLGALKDPKQITLFLTGWIRPSDSSLSVGFAQNPDVDGPVTPQVWVPDADGQWQLSIAPMGFPGGKTKTIAVDLSNAFLTDDFRIRIQTSAEIYWDHVFFSVDEASFPLEIHDLPVAAADLHFRGFSHRYYVDEKSPEWYDYMKLSTTPRWPPMRGMFTRYGDVKELLTASDDRLAVIGAGDEMTVEFREPETVLPAGWRRDFILHCVGYDKDADLNTFEGQSSEPLPFRAMNSYPAQFGETFPETPGHQDYLRRYQTRRQSWNRFWKLLQSDSVKDLETD